MPMKVKRNKREVKVGLSQMGVFRVTLRRWKSVRGSKGAGENSKYLENLFIDKEKSMDRKPIQSHRELEVYQLAFKAAMEIFKASKKFPSEEKYSLTDQIRRSSRSVSANITEAWRKRRYEGSFLLTLNNAEAEAAETQTWLEFAVECEYIDKKTARDLYRTYNQILGKLVNIINRPDPWLLPNKKQSKSA